MEKRKKLNVKRVILIIVLFMFLVVLSIIGLVLFNLRAVDKDITNGSYTVELGTSVYEVFEDLENENIIRSAFLMKVFSKIYGVNNIDAGTYEINPSMSTVQVLKKLKEDNKIDKETIDFTFKEGKNVRDLIEEVEDLVGITESEALLVLNDQEYINSLISEYWFLTDEIKSEGVYYALEGYLFPDTYEIYKDATFKDIIRKMLDQMNYKLTPYKEKIENSNFTVHEFLTLASIIEKESASTDNRDTVAGVFLNRLNSNQPLESCVTTYYAFNINQGDRDLSNEEIYDCSTGYNTRCSSFYGLPIGPIGNAGLLSIEAVISPEEHDYYYFVSDKNQKLYFSKTYSEHVKTTNRLQSEGLWYEY